MQFYLEIVTCDPWNFMMGHFNMIASIQKEELISAFKCSIVVFFDPEVQRAWHMLISSPICYR